MPIASQLASEGEPPIDTAADTLPAGDALLARLSDRLADLPGVVAVVLGGSRVAGIASDRSDLDLYLYADQPPPLDLRLDMVGASSRADVDQRFWETSDAWIDDASGLVVDVTYRSPCWIEAELTRVLDRHEASVGYSTAIWHNVRLARPLIDRGGWFADLQRRAQVAYPEPLRRAIVAKNRPLLQGAMFSFLHQLDDALRRGDTVAAQHRLTAWLASYVDVLFALNRQTHPGEKRLVQFVERSCPCSPAAFGDRVERLIRSTAPPADPASVALVATTLVDDLDALLRADGLLSDPASPSPEPTATD